MYARHFAIAGLAMLFVPSFLGNSAAKEKPNALTVGVSDIGGFHHVPLMQLEESAGIKVRAVAHGGTAEITAALMGGHLNLAVQQPTADQTVPAGEQDSRARAFRR
jgi:tripartite-type tricarboxylate transporter receptor subunit TctC